MFYSILVLLYNFSKREYELNTTLYYVKDSKTKNIPTENSTKTIVSKYLKYQATPTMTSKPPILDAMDFSTENTNDITINISLLTGNVATSSEPNDHIPEEPTPTTAEKHEKERKSEKSFVNLHSSNTTKTENSIMITVEHDAKIVFKNNMYITPVTFEFYSVKKTNQINVFESHKKVFAAMKKMETPQRSLQKRKKDSNIQTPSQKVKYICNNYQSSTKYNDREKCV